MRYLPLFLSLFIASACTAPEVPRTPIYKIYELCRKDKNDPVVVAKFKELGLDDEGGGKGYFRYYKPNTRLEYKLVSVRINSQPSLNSVQGVFITWKKDLGMLNYEEIQEMVGIKLPNRGAVEIRADQASKFESLFYVQNHKSLNHPDSQVTVTCGKNDYDHCWEIQLSCFDFVHPD